MVVQTELHEHKATPGRVRPRKVGIGCLPSSCFKARRQKRTPGLQAGARDGHAVELHGHGFVVGPKDACPSIMRVPTVDDGRGRATEGLQKEPSLSHVARPAVEVQLDSKSASCQVHQEGIAQLRRHEVGFVMFRTMSAQ